jgi:hypothetical protein
MKSSISFGTVYPTLFPNRQVFFHQRQILIAGSNKNKKEN